MPLILIFVRLFFLLSVLCLIVLFSLSRARVIKRKSVNSVLILTPLPANVYRFYFLSLSRRCLPSVLRAATVQGLASNGDVLVSRRDSKKSPLSKKLSDDIISLLCCLKNDSVVPRSLLNVGRTIWNAPVWQRKSKLSHKLHPHPY